MKNTNPEQGERLLAEDDEPIKLVPEAERKAWEPKPISYSRADYEGDKKAREARRGG